jgi:DNA invertase Pin-like site-specific DNA recombinase
MKLSHNIKKSDVKQGPLRAVIYIRVSTLTQKKDGHGLEGQLEACMGLIEKTGMKFVNKYVDGAVSGNRLVETRDGLRKLYEDSEKKNFDVVVVYRVDRLGRSMKIIVDVIDHFTKVDIKIMSCTENVDTTTASGLMTVQMFASIAQYEKHTIGQRLMMGREMVLQQRGETGGRLPYGYKRGEEKKIEISEEYGAVVRNIFKNYEVGYSATKIADLLNKRGIIRKKSKRWYDATIGLILKNREKYEGGVRNNNQGGIRWPVLIYDKVIMDILEIEEMVFSKNVSVGIYVRSSSVEKSFYLKQQEDEINNFITIKKWKNYKTYVDIGNENVKRNGLDELFEDCKKNMFSIIIVKDLTRFGTTLNKLSEIFIHFLDSNIRVISLSNMKKQMEKREEDNANMEKFKAYPNPLISTIAVSDSED